MSLNMSKLRSNGAMRRVLTSRTRISEIAASGGPCFFSCPIGTPSCLPPLNPCTSLMLGSFKLIAGRFGALTHPIQVVVGQCHQWLEQLQDPLTLSWRSGTRSYVRLETRSAFGADSVEGTAPAIPSGTSAMTTTCVVQAISRN